MIKALVTLMLVSSSFAVAAEKPAAPKNCKAFAKIAMKAAIEGTDREATDLADVPSLLDGYKNASFGPGPGVVAMAEYRANVVNQVNAKISALNNLKNVLVKMARENPECFQ